MKRRLLRHFANEMQILAVVKLKEMKEDGTVVKVEGETVNDQIDAPL